VRKFGRIENVRITEQLPKRRKRHKTSIDAMDRAVLTIDFTYFKNRKYLVI